MRIGLFTDTYRPSINGIVFVVEMLKKRLEEQGHEVYIFCPAKSIRRNRDLEFDPNEDHIVRFPSIKGVFFEDYDTSLFFPPVVVQQIAELRLDVVHIFTPSQVGLVGIQAAYKADIPIVMQHSTDLYAFSEDYPYVLPGILLLLSIVLPFAIKLKGHDVAEILKLYRPRRGVTQWNHDIVKRAATILYSKADAVIALSEKSVKQLCSWQHLKRYKYNVTLMPNGVDALPQPTATERRAFCEQFGITNDDEVFGFVGRLAAEKNLDLLIRAAELVVRARPHAKLIFVGDFEYRAELERKANASKVSERIIFTGALPRESLGVVYATMKVFTFPSIKDTQGWVLHEAAHAGLPIVLIDKGVSEVAVDGVNALYARNSASDVAQKVINLLANEDLRRQYGQKSRKIAARFSEAKQISALIDLYQEVVANHVPHKKRTVKRAARSKSVR